MTCVVRVRTVTTAGDDIFVTPSGGAMPESTATVSIMFTFYIRPDAETLHSVYFP